MGKGLLIALGVLSAVFIHFYLGFFFLLLAGILYMVELKNEIATANRIATGDVPQKVEAEEPEFREPGPFLSLLVFVGLVLIILGVLI